MRVIVFFPFFLILLLGCTTIHSIRSDESFMLDSRAKLVFTDNTVMGVYRFSASKDIFIVSNTRTGQVIYFAKSKMKKLIKTHRLMGALRGALILGLPGVIYGYQSAPNNGASMGTSEVWALLYGVFGGAIGVAAGFFLAPKDIYIFSNEKVKEGSQ